MHNNPDKGKASEVDQGLDMDRRISGLLQAMYGSVEREPIPDRFLDLLEKLDAAEKAQKTQQSL